jgi:8-oxo-dGTP pyrophosphatase MutT (NUDIX family)
MLQTNPASPRLTDLRDRLLGFVPADAIEAHHRARMLELLETRTDPLVRTALEPGHFTASSFVLSPDGQALLLILHGKLHRWLQPGGHIEAEDEHVEAAARREVLEEVGVRDLEALVADGLPFDVDVHAIPAGKEPGHAHFDVRFLYRARTWDAVAGSDAQAMRWVPLADVSALESDASVLRAVGKLQRLA